MNSNKFRGESSTADYLRIQTSVMLTLSIISVQRRLIYSFCFDMYLHKVNIIIIIVLDRKKHVLL